MINFKCDLRTTASAVALLITWVLKTFAGLNVPNDVYDAIITLCTVLIGVFAMDAKGTCDKEGK